MTPGQWGVESTAYIVLRAMPTFSPAPAPQGVCRLARTRARGAVLAQARRAGPGAAAAAAGGGGSAGGWAGEWAALPAPPLGRPAPPLRRATVRRLAAVRRDRPLLPGLVRLVDCMAVASLFGALEDAWGILRDVLLGPAQPAPSQGAQRGTLGARCGSLTGAGGPPALVAGAAAPRSQVALAIGSAMTAVARTTRTAHAGARCAGSEGSLSSEDSDGAAPAGRLLPRVAAPPATSGRDSSAPPASAPASARLLAGSSMAVTARRAGRGCCPCLTATSRCRTVTSSRPRAQPQLKSSPDKMLEYVASGDCRILKAVGWQSIARAAAVVHGALHPCASQKCMSGGADLSRARRRPRTKFTTASRTRA